VGVDPEVSTIYDVARAAGVSTATVSRTLNAPERVSEATRERVLAAAERLSYHPSALAQALSHGHSRTIGVLLQPEPDRNPYYQTLIETIDRQAGTLGYEMVVTFFHGTGPTSFEDALTVLERRRPAGYLAYANSTIYIQYEAIGPSISAPFVWLCPTPGDTAPVVCPDEELGARLATQHLLALGHRRIAFACASSHEPIPGRREYGYWRAMEDAGAEPIPIETSDCGPDHGRETALRLLDERRDVTAIIVRNDHTAFGVVRALRERGVRIPGDMSVVGFDDIPLARFCDPPLSTLDMRLADTAKRALGRLLRLAAAGGRQAAGGMEVVAPRLMARESTGPVRTEPELPAPPHEPARPPARRGAAKRRPSGA
jgi:DNA-binding LacI/PurR family transcriptional regulator